jgi:dienelactone hydrolase
VILPFPALSAPTGPYRIGSQIFRWKDHARLEGLTEDPGDHREVIVQAWYPATDSGQGVRIPYLDGLDKLPPKVSILPRFLLRRWDLVETWADQGVAVKADNCAWPVVIFSPGYGASRAFYTSLIAGLASEGFVVLALDHPYEAAIVELSDGRIATTVEKFASPDASRTRFMETRQALRVEDIRFVLDHLDWLPFAKALNRDRVAAIGHSFGGASAARSLESDSRLFAAANIDGTIYGAISEEPLRKPFLLLESDPKDTGHSETYMEGNRKFLARAGKLGRRERLANANHYSFTDVPLLFPPPSRYALSILMGGSRGPAQTHRDTIAILRQFLGPRQ